MSTPGAVVHAPSHARDRSFHPIAVRRVVVETAEASSFVLGIPEALRPAFRYDAGQFCRFRVVIDGTAHERCYSMSSAPADDAGAAADPSPPAELRITVKRVPGGLVSNWLLDHIVEGSVVDAAPPGGLFCLDEAPDEIVALAAGSGITPVFSLLKQAAATSARPARLLYANRDREAVIFGAAIDALATTHPDRVSVTHHLDVDHGYVTTDTVARHLRGTDPAAVTCYVCGPGPFMDVVEEALLDHGVPAPRIHIERFTPEEQTDPSPVPTREPQGDDPAGGATVITIELDGRTATTSHRRGTTVLQSARQAGLSPPFSCEAGNCATCIARIVEGSADMHINNVLAADEVEDGWLLTCQGVPTSPTLHVVYGEDG